MTNSTTWSSDLDGQLGSGRTINTTLSVGTHTVTASVTDSDGNTAQDTTTVIVEPNTVPSVSITGGGGTYLDGQTVQLQGTASDAEDGDLTGSIAWSSNLDGGLGTGGSVSTTLSVGTHTVTASVTDSDGNNAQDTMTVVVEPNTVPSVSITGGGGTYLDGQTVQLQGTASDAEDGDLTASIAWSSDLDGPLGSGGSVNATLSVGTHTVTASVTDSDGNTSEATTTVVVSSDTVPSISITDGGGTYLEGQTVPLQATASDAEDGNLTASIAWSSDLDGPLGSGGSVNATLSVGTHTVTASVTDSDGNTSEATTTVVVSSDTVPSISITGGGGTYLEGQTVPLQATASDAEDGDLTASIAWSSDLDGALGTGGSVSTTLSVGTHTVTASVTDSGGNTAQDTTTVTIESSLPVVTINAVDQVDDTDGLPGENVDVAGSATDTEDGELPPDTFRWFVNGEEVTAAIGQAAPTLRLLDGDNTVELEVTDSSGLTNTGSRRVVVAARIRGQGPISSIPGLSETEKETAVGLETTCSNIRYAGMPTSDQDQLLGLCDTLAADSSSPAEVAETLKAISGLQITSLQSTSIDFAKVQMGNIGSRISALRRLGLEATRGVSTTGLNLNLNGRPVPLAAVMNMGQEFLLGSGASANQQQDDSGGGYESPSTVVTVFGQRPRLNPRLGIFINGNAAFGDKDPTDNEAGFDFDSRGLTFGLDYLFTDELVGGVAFGYGNAEAKFLGNTGEQQSDSVSGTLFGTLVRDRWFLSSILGYASLDYDSVRQITASLLSEDAVAEGTTTGDSVFGGLSMEYNAGNGSWYFGPAASINFIEANIGGFSETGAGGLNLMYSDQTAKSVTARLGLRLERTFSTTWGALSLEGRGDYVKEFEQDRQLISINFINDPFINELGRPSSTYTVAPDQADENFFSWGIGLSYALPGGISGFIDYQNVFGLTGIKLSEVTAGLRFQMQFR